MKKEVREQLQKELIKAYNNADRENFDNIFLELAEDFAMMATIKTQGQYKINSEFVDDLRQEVMVAIYEHKDDFNPNYNTFKAYYENIVCRHLESYLKTI